MKIFNNVLELIGGTPLVYLNKITKDLDVRIAVKVESFNPCGSVKDRIDVRMILDAEKKNIINKDTVIVEPTSGNTGVGLSFVCAVKGYKLILVMPENMSVERRNLLKFLGADLVLSPAEKGMAGAVELAEEIVKEKQNCFMPQQFNNPSNPLAHYEGTAVEIWNDTEGKVDIFVAGIGTGGTITGVGKFLKEKNSDIEVYGVEPSSSPFLTEGKAGKHRIQGIGAGFLPDVLDKSILDGIIKVGDDEAAKMCRKLAQEEGILAGLSSGACVWAACEIAKQPENHGKLIVAVLPDTGERYLSLCDWILNI